MIEKKQIRNRLNIDYFKILITTFKRIIYFGLLAWLKSYKCHGSFGDKISGSPLSWYRGELR